MAIGVDREDKFAGDPLKNIAVDEVEGTIAEVQPHIKICLTANDKDKKRI